MNIDANNDKDLSFVGVIANSNNATPIDDEVYLQNLKPEDAISSATQKLIHEKIKNKDYIFEELVFLKTLQLNHECIKIITEAELKEYIRKGELQKGCSLLDTPYITQTFLQSPEMIDVFEERIIKYAKKGWTLPIDTITDEYNIPLSVLSSTKVIEAAEEGMFFCFSEGYFTKAEELYEIFPVRSETFHTPRSLSMMIQGKAKNKSNNGKEALKNIIQALNIPLFCEE